MDTTTQGSAGNAKQSTVAGLILEEVGAGWHRLTGSLWESPSGELYVSICVADAIGAETKPPQR